MSDKLRSQLDHADRIIASICDALLGPPQGDRRTKIDDLPRIANELRTERDRLRAVVDELQRAAEGPVSDAPADGLYAEGNNTAWAYVLRCIKQGT